MREWRKAVNKRRLEEPTRRERTRTREPYKGKGKGEDMLVPCNLPTLLPNTKCPCTKKKSSRGNQLPNRPRYWRSMFSGRCKELVHLDLKSLISTYRPDLKVKESELLKSYSLFMLIA